MAKSSTVRKPAPPPDITVTPENHADLVAVQGDGAIIREFFANLQVFFSRAGGLEAQAKQTIAEARLLRPPTTLEADVELQRFVQRTTAEKKAIELHWEDVTRAFFKLHRALTSGRDRGVKLLEEANRLGNRLHADWTESQDRIRRQEEDRIRREAEEHARQERQRELDELERQAAKAEAESPDLSERQTRFVELVANGINTPVAAARIATFKDPEITAVQLMKTPKILSAIEALKKAAAIRRQAEAVKEAPIEVRHEPVQRNVGRAPGAHDRTTWSGEGVDFDAAMDAFISGKFGIPRDVFMFNPVQINVYARAMEAQLERWPGFQARKSTKVI